MIDDNKADDLVVLWVMSAPAIIMLVFIGIVLLT